MARVKFGGPTDDDEGVAVPIVAFASTGAEVSTNDSAVPSSAPSDSAEADTTDDSEESPQEPVGHAADHDPASPTPENGDGDGDRGVTVVAVAVSNGDGHDTTHPPPGGTHGEPTEATPNSGRHCGHTRKQAYKAAKADLAAATGGLRTAKKSHHFKGRHREIVAARREVKTARRNVQMAKWKAYPFLMTLSMLIFVACLVYAGILWNSTLSSNSAISLNALSTVNSAGTTAGTTNGTGNTTPVASNFYLHWSCGTSQQCGSVWGGMTGTEPTPYPSMSSCQQQQAQWASSNKMQEGGSLSVAGSWCDQNSS